MSEPRFTKIVRMVPRMAYVLGHDGFIRYGGEPKILGRASSGPREWLWSRHGLVPAGAQAL